MNTLNYICTNSNQELISKSCQSNLRMSDPLPVSDLGAFCLIKTSF